MFVIDERSANHGRSRKGSGALMSRLALLPPPHGQVQNHIYKQTPAYFCQSTDEKWGGYLCFALAFQTGLN